MASNGLCDRSTGGRDLALLRDERRLRRTERPLIDLKGLLPKLSTEAEGMLTASRERELVVCEGTSFVAS